MNGPITYEMLSAVFAALVVVGGAWFFIDRRQQEMERKLTAMIDAVEREASLQTKAVIAELALLRETVFTKYVSNDALIRLEERIVSELRELRRFLNPKQ